MSTTYQIPPNKPGGRPRREFKEEYCEQLISHMSEGYSFESFAARLRTSNDVLYRWSREEPSFQEAKAVASDLCREFWERLGMAGIVGKIPGFNASVWIFNMKNRFKWRDRHDIEVQGQINVQHEALTIDQIKEIFRNDPFIQLEKGKGYGTINDGGSSGSISHQPALNAPSGSGSVEVSSNEIRSGEGLSSGDVQDPFRKTV